MFYGASLYNCPFDVAAGSSLQSMAKMLEGATEFSQQPYSWSFPVSADTTDIFKDSSMTYCTLYQLSRLNSWKSNNHFGQQYARLWSGPNPCAEEQARSIA